MERWSTVFRRKLGSSWVWLSVLLLVACGGTNDEAPRDGSTVGAAGGVVAHADGAQVTFPAQALRSDVTVRIAKDGTGAPPLPNIAQPAGAVFMVTPHGGGFDVPAQLSIPVERRDIAANEQLVLLTAEPGDAQWRVLSGARYDGQKLHVPVSHFSFFQAAVIVDRWVPTLVSTIDGKNNLGGGGIGRIEPFHEITGERSDVRALMTWPDLSLFNGLSGPTQPPRACLPTAWGHGAAEWRFVRDGTELLTPSVHHRRVKRAEPWPRQPSDWGTESPYWREGESPEAWVGGYGALHYYGDESPRIYGYADAGPFYEWSNNGQDYLTVGDLYTLPPTHNRSGDDLLTWNGRVGWMIYRRYGGNPHPGLNPPNGQIRIDVALMTDCNLLVEAPPLVFRLNAPLPETGLGLVYPVVGAIPPVVDYPVGSEQQILFRGDGYTDWGRTVLEFSPDPARVAWTPVDASRAQQRVNGNELVFDLRFPSVTRADAGYYRASYCSRGIEGSLAPGCEAGPAAGVRVFEVAPIINAQPASVTVVQGETASFTVGAWGGPQPGIQWERRDGANAVWVPIPGANAATYTTPPTTLANAGNEFRAVLTNPVGELASGAAVLTVVERYIAPTFSSQPGNLETPVGGTAVFAATVEGTAPFSYQWRRNGSPITGANSPILTLYNVTGANDGEYELVVSNREGSATSQKATLTVVVGTPQTYPVTIVNSPRDMGIAEGYAGTLAVGVSGTGPFTYQWMKGDNPIPGATEAAYTIYPAQPSDYARYWVQVGNVLGTANSRAATVTIAPLDRSAPQIIAGPTSLALPAGLAATIAVSVSGASPLSYQWRRDGIDLPGATQSVLHLPSVGAFDAGRYSVAVYSPWGSVVSSEAQLVVIGAPSITGHPVATSAGEGSSASFTVTALGNGLRYQWLRDRIAIRDANAASYTTPALTPADSGARFSVLVYNGAGAEFSQEAELTVTPAAQSGWSAPATIQDSGTTFHPAVGMDATGRALAVWAAYPPGQSVARTYAATGTAAGGWTAPALIDNGLANGYESRIAMAPNGQAVASWGYKVGSAYHLAAARFDGNQWGAAVRVDTSLPGNADEQFVAIDDNGRALLVWTQPDAGRYGVYASIHAGSGWSTPVAIDRGARSSGVISIAVNGSGQGFVLFSEGSDTVVAVPVNLGSGFGAAQVVREPGRTVGRNRVTVDANGNALAVWIDGTLDGDRLRYARFTPGAGWGSPADVAAIGWPFDHQLALAGAANGDAVAAWSVAEGNRMVVQLRRFTPGGGWGPIEPISTAGRHGDTPQVRMNATGRMVVSWVQMDATGSIMQVWAWVHDGAWRDAQLLQTSSHEVRSDWQRGLAIGPSGSAVSLWSEWVSSGLMPLLGAIWP